MTKDQGMHCVQLIEANAGFFRAIFFLLIWDLFDISGVPHNFQ